MLLLLILAVVVAVVGLAADDVVYNDVVFAAALRLFVAVADDGDFMVAEDVAVVDVVKLEELNDEF